MRKQTAKMWEQELEAALRKREQWVNEQYAANSAVLNLLRSSRDVLLRIEKLLEKAAMTGHKTKLPNARVKDGKLEIDPPRKRLPPHIKYAMDKKQKVKRGKRI